MSSENNMPIKASLFGFKRADVLAYIEKAAEIHRATLEEHKKERESFAAQREADRLALQKLEEELSALKDDKEALEQSADKLPSMDHRLETQRANIESLEQSLREKKEQCAKLSDEVEMLRAQVSAWTARDIEFQSSKQHLADLELEAINRANEVRSQARRDIAAMRLSVQDMYRDICHVFEEVHSDATATIAHIDDELSKTRSQVARFDALFDEISSKLRGLELPALPDE